MQNMGVIRISDASEQFLYEQSRMGDSFDSVLRRLHPEIKKYDKPVRPASGGAGATPPANSGRLGRRRAKRGTVAPAGMFKSPIMRVLLRATGHKLPMADVLGQIEQLVKPKLSALDYEPLASGGVIRWVNRAQWDRAEMVREGLLEPPTVSGRGIWMLSPKGVTEAKKLK